jgi:hypothetical protein
MWQQRISQWLQAKHGLTLINPGSKHVRLRIEEMSGYSVVHSPISLGRVVVLNRCHNVTPTRGEVQTHFCVDGGAVTCNQCNVCTTAIRLWWLEIPGEYKLRHCNLLLRGRRYVV